MKQKRLRVDLFDAIIAQRVWPTEQVLQMVHLNLRRCIHLDCTCTPSPRTNSTDRWCCSHGCMTKLHFLNFPNAKDEQKANINKVLVSWRMSTSAFDLDSIKRHFAHLCA